jgi:hypothetical protein
VVVGRQVYQLIMSLSSSPLIRSHPLITAMAAKLVGGFASSLRHLHLQHQQENNGGALSSGSAAPLVALSSDGSPNDRASPLLDAALQTVILALGTAGARAGTCKTLY